MKIILTEWYREWQESMSQQPDPVTLDLTNKTQLQFLVLSLGRGNFDEVSIETDSSETLTYITELLKGTGGAEPAVADTLVTASRLYQAGYHIFRQEPYGIFFVNPKPRPDLFAVTDQGEYAGRQDP